MIVYAGKYEEVRLLGNGTTGDILLVKDLRTGQHLSLKLLKTRLGSVSAKTRADFASEFGTLKGLSHPALVKVHDAGFDTETGRFFFVTDFVDGLDLMAATKDASFGEKEGLFVQALRALNYLHNQQIQHFDIKPQNILVTCNAGGTLQLKLIDFGYANFCQRQAALDTNTKLLIGTPVYMPPEIIDGKPADNRADLYSLACTFYKIFTRKPVFEGRFDQELYQQHLQVLPTPPTQIDKSLPEYTNTILLKLLAKNPGERYPSAQQVIEDLNLWSGRFYPVETIETSLSYVPTTGPMIGREQALTQFKTLYADRIKTKSFKALPYLVITGSQGTGKTRFLDHCLKLVQQDFVATLSWEEAGMLSCDEMPNPCVVFGDAVTVKPEELEYLSLAFGETAVLTVLATTESVTGVSEPNMVSLSSFDRTNTTLFLAKATGLQHLPDPLIETVFKHTLGNPLALTEYVQALFARGLLKDAHGSWTPDILEDLGDELSTCEPSLFVKKRLEEHLHSLNLEPGELKTLGLIALIAEAPCPRAKIVLKKVFPETDCQPLVKAGLITDEGPDTFCFTNPLMQQVALQTLAANDHCLACDRIAETLVALLPKEREAFWFFGGHGSGAEAPALLMKLAGFFRKNLQFDKARETLTLAITKSGCNPVYQAKAVLDLAGLDLDTGLYTKALSLLSGLVEKRPDKNEDTVMVQAYELMGRCHENLDHSTESQACYQKALDLIGPQRAPLWLWVNIMNRLAQAALRMGNKDHAGHLFDEVWQVWANELSPAEKVLAIRSDIDEYLVMTGRPDLAAACLEAQIEILKNHRHLIDYVVALCKLARLKRDQGEFDQARDLFEECLKEIHARRSPFWIYNIYNDLGILFQKAGQFKEALAHFRRAFDLAGKKGLAAHTHIVAHNIGFVNRRLGNLTEAKKYLQFSVDALRTKNHDTLYIVQTFYEGLVELAGVAREQGRFEEAKAFLAEAKTVLEARPALATVAKLYWEEQAYSATTR